MKKAWDTPRLVILVRSSVPESVLTVCKESGLTGANDYNNGCFYGVDMVATCGARAEMLGIGNALTCAFCSALVQS